MSYAPSKEIEKKVRLAKRPMPKPPSISRFFTLFGMADTLAPTTKPVFEQQNTRPPSTRRKTCRSPIECVVGAPPCASNDRSLAEVAGASGRNVALIANAGAGDGSSWLWAAAGVAAATANIVLNAMLVTMLVLLVTGTSTLQVQRSPNPGRNAARRIYRHQ